MKTILFVIGGIVFANIVFATFIAPTPIEERPASIVNAATQRGQEPWATNEPLINHGRANARKAVLDALNLPTVSICSANGRKQLIDALNYYYGQRARQ